MRHKNSLVRRVVHLERRTPVDHRDEWPAFLVACLAEPQYDAHREAIIRALLSDTPMYEFEITDEHGNPANCLLSWYHRDDGLVPPVIIWITVDARVRPTSDLPDPLPCTASIPGDHDIVGWAGANATQGSRGTEADGEDLNAIDDLVVDDYL